MTTVAQKTLLLTKVSIFLAFLLVGSNSYAINSETISYKVSLNGVSVGDAIITFKPDPFKKTYKLLAKAETKGFSKRLYDMNDSVLVYGNIIDNQLIPTSHSLIINENNYKANKTGVFNYKDGILHYINNLKGYKYDFILVNNAKDIFSTLYTLRFNTDLRLIKNNKVFERTVQLVDKTLENKIKLTDEFNYNISKNKSIKVRNVLISSKRIKHKELSKDMLSQLKENKDLKPTSFFNQLKLKKQAKKFETNIKVMISSDDKKIPLIIEYKTKFGTFKAVAKNF